ncbi:FGGY family carbohydrate kinase [Marinimicrobium sp. C6131]|uniref:FGGY-family carbohydrate kinase n=1 Tax=Marinimicrobium sp. C6131 TaxID=3022676 RepID=UPI00223E37AC|nr:FGGY family carbohydrate kinase [Marinimicrobium sp. C6131]UZJ44954.1 FGGY family carbohydrate kinase [Marinimicrobium sp. C6131]
MSNILILDIGKTNIKVHVLDEHLESRFEKTRRNAVVENPLYPHFDVDAIWDWFCETVREVAKAFSITAISVTTHGATAALVDRHSSGNGLVLPVLDYEYGGPDEMTSDYACVRPDFSETRSPDLSAGLNLGRQLYWLRQRYPEAFGKATDVLLYPQYWVWRMTGKRCSERTSLGCHTDLWSPERNDYSSLVDRMGWRALFPELKAADSLVGPVCSDFIARTGLPASCQVAVGIHDSNASYLRYLLHNDGQPFSVISTGTWAITMTHGGANAELDEARDMLMNVDYRGTPVPCARFMGGREYEAICYRLGSYPEEPFSVEDIETVLADAVYALPQFCDTSGPFSGTPGRIEGSTDRINGAALASVYSALMLDLELDLLKARGAVFVEGAFLKNSLLCRLLATLRGDNPVYLSNDSTGTVKGAASLALSNPDSPEHRVLCESLSIDGLEHYKAQWRNYCQAMTLESSAASL